MPDFNPYVEPLNPAAQYSLKDRAQLVVESCRPWAEFLDPHAFAPPPASEAKLRVGHNVEVFFYNYLVLAMALLAVFAVFHPVRAVLLAATVAVAAVLYILFPEDYQVTDNIVISMPIKHAVMAVLTVLVLVVGHVFALLFWVAVTFAPIVLVHAFLRQHSAAPADANI
ncbi:unnamed protein product [Chondrus crispus]|uniref:PRA1 family protein n=1 Tax=Chondrus crispus TaxID=2769 RepID=R7QRI6_CHOCR|nr:unnamed protein product [Chondrus crispus]CDF40363.1 unnamed protein product [Chondrus crispus]|eukprot:XP_005710657.1 unnamed protein product [Chondrus crispus]